MKEIIFRGKRTENGEWVYGYYCPCVFGNFPAEPAIIDADELKNGRWAPVKVTRKSVGQYTGLTDKNRKPIFEGDIVNINNDRYAIHFGDAHLECCGCTYDYYHVGFVLRVGNYMVMNQTDYKEMEVIGNIWDNPEMIKEAEQ